MGNTILRVKTEREMKNGQAWSEVRTIRPGREFQKAYAERRRELETAAAASESERRLDAPRKEHTL